MNESVGYLCIQYRYGMDNAAWLDVPGHDYYSLTENQVAHLDLEKLKSKFPGAELQLISINKRVIARGKP